MRVVVFVVTMLMIATTSEASSSCMSRSEARQHFGSVHIYWHGADHCWDATSTRLVHRAVHKVERKIDQPRIDQSKIDQSKGQDSNQDFGNQVSKGQASKSQDSKSQDSGRVDAKWRDSMSKMMPEDEPVQAPVQAPVIVQGSWADRWVDIEPVQLPLSARWLDIAPVTPPPSKSVPDPELRIMVLALVSIVIALMLAMVEVLFRAARGAAGRPGRRVIADGAELSSPRLPC
ncbi:MAG TPA: hypothetical protein VHB49_17515 [Bradyrhizobium sp.]|nr:hypothetical protein [Bradyrhizobium sp.]